MFELGKFPEILKTSKVATIDKKDSKVDCNNFRPISLTSSLSKILEKIMCDKLY